MSQKNTDEHPHLQETEIESTQVFCGRLLDVRQDHVR